MAVLESLQGIEVTVLVDGEALKEYDAENDNVVHENDAAAAHQRARTVTKYIESTTGKTFLVKIDVKAPYQIDCPNVSFSLSVDGQHIRSPLMGKAKYASGNWSTNIEGPVERLNSRGQVAIMKFAEIQSTDEATESETLLQHGLETDRVGEIIVKASRCSRGKGRAYSGTTFNQLDLSKKYHEKILAKDAKSHGVALGDKKPTKLGRHLKTTDLDGKEFPMAIFRFKYRSTDALQCLHILPRVNNKGLDDEQVATESEDEDLDDLSPQQRKRVEKMLARAKGIVKSEPSIKRDHSDGEEDVKPPKRTKVAKKKMIGKTIIDLTEVDDDENKAPDVSLD